MIKETIEKFPQQFKFKPELSYEEKLLSYKNITVAGMGGSALGAGLLLSALPDLPLRIHRDYDLPQNLEKNELIITSSYSGNTEETISAYTKAHDEGRPLAVISVGGKLLARADHDQTPHITLPDTGIQPRMSLGYMVIALLTILKKEDELEKIKSLTEIMNSDDLEKAGKKLSTTLKDRVPVFYASNQNHALAYVAKIGFNEIGKIPAFMNVLPELNHNEMTGFDRLPTSTKLSDNFSIIFLNDSDDQERIKKRSSLTEKILKGKGLLTTSLEIEGQTRWEKIFKTIILMDWAAYYTAYRNGADPQNVPMIEEFKKQLN
jgi:glucose/mannose-6-phosphate isomerase